MLDLESEERWKIRVRWKDGKNTSIPVVGLKNLHEKEQELLKNEKVAFFTSVPVK
jgi:hypothetical protein